MTDYKENIILSKMEIKSHTLSSFFNIARGLANNNVDFNNSSYLALKSTNVNKYRIEGNLVRIGTKFADRFINDMIILPRTVLYLKATLKPKNIVCLDRIYYLLPKYENVDNLYYLGIINSRIINYWFNLNYWCEKVSGNYFDLNGNQILSIVIPENDLLKKHIADLVSQIMKGNNNSARNEIDDILYSYYNIEPDEIELIKNEEYPYK